MSATTEDSGQKIVKFVQQILLEEPDLSRVGRDLIGQKIDLVLAMMPAWKEGLDREAVTDELVRRFSMWVGRDATLKDEAGHLAWLDSARKKDWRLWRRYREFMEKDLSVRAVEALDRSTDSILELLEDPVREGNWDRRGLVVGHVQSGKTGNYTGLVCKAADAGYKIVIVLAGLHNNLRSQTQMRLDEGFLGYATAAKGDELPTIGVGHIDGDSSIRPNYVTNRTEKGDFSAAAAANLGIKPEQRPWLFVVKKNKTVLQRLLAWIRNHVADSSDAETGLRIVTRLPLLVIDDEADHASVDTGDEIMKEGGAPDEEHSPTAINGLIRRILNSFTRKAYVGYTATPFANIFIYEQARTLEEGPDLFPSAFIINLAAPSTYVGPARVFGLRVDEAREGVLPLVRLVGDQQDSTGTSGWMPPGHKNTHVPRSDEAFGIPASLRRAVLSFLLACAARQLRGQGHKHCSMLVHVTRFKNVQEHVHRQIDDAVVEIRQRLAYGVNAAAVLGEMEQLWNADFAPTTASVLKTTDDPSIRGCSWQEILAVLPDAAADIHVRMINGTSRDALDYVENTAKGLKVIAIGGDKLARGLTLEGLCTSYFLRASRMYDTLMQMGRWFGYRPGYLDLCRLYTTSDLVEWFEHIADASEELRGEFDLMAATGGTPKNYGLKVASHPVLMVTSRMKMRSARPLSLSFSGRVLETITFHRDATVLQANLDLFRHFVGRLGRPAVPDMISLARPNLTQVWQGHLWKGVAHLQVSDMLRSYRTHQSASKVDAPLLAEFIDRMAATGELVSWTVALIGGGDNQRIELADGIGVTKLTRRCRIPKEDSYSIGRLLSPRDETIDMDATAWQAALKATRATWSSDTGRDQTRSEPEFPNGPSVRQIRGFGAPGVAARPQEGLLLLYVLARENADPEVDPSMDGVAAFGISFPASNSDVQVEYMVTELFYRQEFEWERDADVPA